MAYIQLNDPDPIYWVAVYAITAIIAGANFFGKRLENFSKVAIGMVIAGILISAPGAIDYFAANDYSSIYDKMNPNKPYIESAREFGGLFIAAIYLLIFELSKKSSP